MSTVTPPRVRQLDDNELATTRRAFIDAALEITAQKAMLDFAVADVVRRSGWHNAAFYRIFGSKDGLLLALAEDAVAKTAALLATRANAAPSPAQAVRVWTTTLLHRAASPSAATATQPFALDRHRILHRFPDADGQLTLPIRAILHDVLRAAGRPDAQAAGDAATELVLSQQATWLACHHRPTEDEIDQCVLLVLRLVGLESDGPRPAPEPS